MAAMEMMMAVMTRMVLVMEMVMVLVMEMVMVMVMEMVMVMVLVMEMVMVLVMEMATKLSKHYSPSLRPLPVWVVVAKGAFQVGLQTICSEVSDAK